jgi:hypothetical protein
MRKSVLWGHRYSEYRDMFDLPADLGALKLLEFACGPTLVNHELSSQNCFVRSVDPWFEADIALTKEAFNDKFNQQKAKMRQYPKRYDADKYGGMDALFARRTQGFEGFFEDYAKAYQSRYFKAEAFQLPFENASFDLVVCSNYFFADLPDEGLDFHLAWFKELSRVAHDIRIYPLTAGAGVPSTLIGPILMALQILDYRVSVQEVPFRLIPSSKAMLKIETGRCRL